MSKKKQEEPPKILLGRPGNHLKCGIVGLPNVGKSTLFSIMTKMSVPAENFPFCTIDPNESRVAVPDDRFTWLCQHWKPASKVPAFLEVIDIAGLVRGAAEGQGLGNAFLSHIKAVDGIFHVVRIFEDVEISHVEGALDPIRDLEIIRDELMLKDKESLAKAISATEGKLRADKTKKVELEILKKVQDWVVNQGKEVRHGDWKASEVEVINQQLLLSAKPVIYLVNMAENDFLRKKNKWLVKIKNWVDEHGGGSILPFCAKFEAQLMEMDAEEVKKLETEKGVTSVIPKMIRTGYHSLDLVHFFTSGKDEVRCWTIRNGTKAPAAAGVIHTDFERGFICAEVMKFTDYKEHGSDSAAKAAGKYLQQGKNYTVLDGDIIFFKFNAGAGLSGKK